MSPQLATQTTPVDPPTSTPPSGAAPCAHELLTRGFALMESWDDAEAAAIIAPHYTNAEASSEPPAARLPGIAGVRATYDWLHHAYDDLHWTLDTIVAEGEWVVARTTMSGRHSGPFTTYGADGQVASEVPATGRQFAVSQSHWYRIADGQLVEHRADRDDLGQAMQLGWLTATTTSP
jgi:predicted ester cyclase